MVPLKKIQRIDHHRLLNMQVQRGFQDVEHVIGFASGFSDERQIGSGDQEFLKFFRGNPSLLALIFCHDVVLCLVIDHHHCGGRHSACKK